MATTADYLTQLQADKQTLVDNLVAKGVEASNDETFTTLAPKVADIQSGGGSDIKIMDASYLFANNARSNEIDNVVKLISPDCENFKYMFNGFSGTSIPLFNTSNGKNFYYFAYAASNLTSFPAINTSKATDLSYMVYNCPNLTEFPLIDTSSCEKMSSMFQRSGVKHIPALNTSKVWDISSCFRQAPIESIPLLDFSSASAISYMFYGTTTITTLGGFKDLGKAYIKSYANYTSYTLDLTTLTLLTHDSILNVFNNVYDLATNGYGPQQIIIATACQSLLSDEEIAIATNKGWNVLFK